MLSPPNYYINRNFMSYSVKCDALEWVFDIFESSLTQFLSRKYLHLHQIITHCLTKCGVRFFLYFYLVYKRENRLSNYQNQLYSRND